MKFCANMYLDNRMDPVEFHSHRPKAKVNHFSLVNQIDLVERGKNGKNRSW